MLFERIRKSVFVRIAAAVVCILFIAAGLNLRRLFQKPMPTFNFLNVQSQAVRVEEIKSGNNAERFLYSFKADYNAVCAAADKELTALGYVQFFLPGQGPHMCVYKLHNQRPGEEITVRVFDVPKVVKDSTSKNSESLDPDLFTYVYGDGYVLVDISYRQPQNLSRWAYLKYWCRRLFP